MAGLKRPKEPEFSSTPQEVDACWKMVKTLEQPLPRLSSDYDRSIRKSHEAKKRSKSSSASRKLVAQLGEQKNQSCPPLNVFSDTDVGSSIVAAEQYDTEIVALYGEAAVYA